MKEKENCLNQKSEKKMEGKIVADQRLLPHIKSISCWPSSELKVKNEEVSNYWKGEN